MAKLEIERRFLLKKLPNDLGEGKLTEQVYLSLVKLKIKDDFLYYEDKSITQLIDSKELKMIINSNKKNYACRVRRQDNNYIFTIKVREAPGIRKEWEWGVGNEFKEYFHQKLPRVSKIRYKLRVDNYVWEIDEFLENNSGLIIAEIELESLENDINLPSWAVEEITGEIKYLNSELSKQ